MKVFINIDVNSNIEKWLVVAFTNAPARYDYPFTINLFEANDPTNTLEDGKNVGRIVLIEDKRLDEQMGRNSSGLYVTIPLEPEHDVTWIMDLVQQELWKRVFGAPVA